MASKIDWDSIPGGDGSKSRDRKAEFLRFESGKTYTVRPVGDGVQFCKIFDRAVGRSVVVHTEDAEKAAELLSSHSGRDIRPQKRFAINVIDRADGRIKILEGGRQIFKHFAVWVHNNNNAALGGKQGGDWAITVEGDGLNRTYTPAYIRPAPLTKDEIKLIKEKAETYSLSEVYKPVPLDEVVERMYGSDSSEAQGSEPAASEVSDAVSESELPW